MVEGVFSTNILKELTSTGKEGGGEEEGEPWPKPHNLQKDYKFKMDELNILKMRVKHTHTTIKLYKTEKVIVIQG